MAMEMQMVARAYKTVATARATLNRARLVPLQGCDGLGTGKSKLILKTKSMSENEYEGRAGSQSKTATDVLVLALISVYLIYICV